MTLKWQINGPGHYWSLAVEEHFYLIWPILIYYFNDKKLKYIFILLILLSILSRYILLKNHLETFYFTTSRMSDLIFGAFLSLYETKLKLKKIIILLLTILTFKIVLFYNFIFLNNIIFESFSFIFLTSIYTLIIGIMLLTKNNNIFKKALQSFYFRFTGKVSYGLYIYHPLVLIIVEKYLKINNLIFNILTCFLITYLISYLSFIFFESKFLNLKQKY
jgi:peptidoglycan/LPS O-acetylase OafA/YrhL